MATGFQSHAEGRWTKAGGYVAHAEAGYTLASGTYSHAAGFNAKATNDNTFVWSDGAAVGSTTSQQFIVYAGNGIRLLGGLTDMAGIPAKGDLSMGTFTNMP
jgi:hypothetical protein